MFEDRKDAGKKLSIALKKYKNENPIILAIPRGGIITAYETIKRFGFDFDLIIPRKIGLPSNKEIAIGAISLDGTCLLNDEFIGALNIPKDYIERQIFEQTEEIKRRLKKYKGNDNFPDVKNKTVIIIDDGIATGFTILAAIQSLKKFGTKKIILAVPVGPQDTISKLEKIVDEIICLLIPNSFYGVGYYYRDFTQISDLEVFDIISELRKYKTL